MNDELHRLIGKLDGKMDIVLERTAKFEKNDEDFDHRITALESQAHTVKTIAAIIASVATLVMTFAADFLKTKFFGSA